MTVSQEFMAAVHDALQEFLGSLEPGLRAVASEPTFYLLWEITQEQLAVVKAGDPGVPQDAGPERFLGLYSSNPPQIYLYEGALWQRAQRLGVPLVQVVKDTIAHEVLQHHFGVDHTLQRAAHYREQVAAWAYTQRDGRG